MTTKKQKRAAGLAKREAFLQEERERGLQAQAADRRYREAELEDLRKEFRAENARLNAILEGYRY